NALFEIAALTPIGIRHDCLASNLMKSNILRGMPCGGRNWHCREDPFRETRNPLQDLHPAHRTSCDAEKLVDTEAVNKHRLRANHVLDRNERKFETIGPSGCGIKRGRPRRAHAAPYNIRC